MESDSSIRKEQSIPEDANKTVQPELKEDIGDPSSNLDCDVIALAESIEKKLVLSDECEKELPQEDCLTEEVEELVDICTNAASAIKKEVQGSMRKLYPVPWASVKSVSYLLSLIKSDNMVFLTPKEAATTLNRHVLLGHHDEYVRMVLAKMETVDSMKKLLTDGLELVSGRMDQVRGFAEKCEGQLEAGSERKVALECKLYLRQTAQDVSFLAGRMEQYVFERSNLFHLLDRFMRKPKPLFPAYKDL